jgi:energy-coupling factor transport system ATP-binding protein
VGVSFQNANDQFFKNTVKGELMAGLGSGGPQAEKRMEEMVMLFELHELLHRSPYRLSEGQKKRVAIASILIMGPRILVLDEPTVGQDGRFLEAMARILASLRERGITIVLVTHDLEFVHATAQRLVLVDRGRVAGVAVPGSPEEETLLAGIGANRGDSWPATKEAA